MGHKELGEAVLARAILDIEAAEKTVPILKKNMTAWRKEMAGTVLRHGREAWNCLFAPDNDRILLFSQAAEIDLGQLRIELRAKFPLVAQMGSFR